LRKQWNQKLSGLRIFVEHAFGRLKGRFPYIQCIPGRNLEEIYRTIEALLVIHNILEDLDDDPSAITDVDLMSQENEPDTAETGTLTNRTQNEDILYSQGVYRRKLLVDYLKNRAESR
jgi:hypothetical protein